MYTRGHASERQTSACAGVGVESIGASALRPRPRCGRLSRTDGVHRAGRACRPGRQRSACGQGDRWWPHAPRCGAGPEGAGRRRHARGPFGGGARDKPPERFGAMCFLTHTHRVVVHGGVSARMRVAVCRLPLTSDMGAGGGNSTPRTRGVWCGATGRHGLRATRTAFAPVCRASARPASSAGTRPVSL